ncbi:hypothetical protein CAEBREN_32794 [Caenorhabditis brenneri]|uniref:F-box domain-containing protein n=1 Tax=Caenorhabditis brenneri TaxID=135651 RepID=G0N066_CAEBE|nr:hypothetical protein CAEBREN_32794 [Caenorhabditis brenneri]
MATKKEIDELLVFIGGFENWPLLNEDCRREVVKYLDYQSRFKLGICSKNDHDTVEKTKIYVKSITITDVQKLHYNNKEGFDNVNVLIEFPTGNSFEWIFSQLEQDTRVQSLGRIHTQRPVVKEFIWKSCDYYEEAVKFAEKWMRKSNFEVERIIVGMAKYPFATSQIKMLPCCKQVMIRDDNVDSFKWWLKKCPEQLDFLELTALFIYRNSLILPSDFLNIPQVMQASNISFWGLTAFSDEQLLKLKAKSMQLSSAADVTDNGINKFIRNWVYGKTVDGFKDLHLLATTVRDPDVMLAGLDDVKKWDEEFENEQWDFVAEFYRLYSKRCYQVKNKVDRFESLTLSINGDYVRIFATGKRAEKNGEAYTYYRIP